MEVEAKFSIPDEETFQRLLDLDSLAGLHLWPMPAVDVADRYFDTAEGDLWAAGVACRVRSEGDRFAGTVKGLGNAEGAIHHRIEVEVELADATPPGNWPAGEPREMVESLSHGRRLEPLFDLEQQRHRRVAGDSSRAGDSAVAEISFDRVRAGYGQAWMTTYLEAEVELLPGGSVEDLTHIAAHLADRWRLIPQPASKFERALELFNPSWSQADGRSAPGRAGRRGPEMAWDDPMSEAGRKALQQQFQKMLCNEAGTRLGEDPEALHDMRVATRRMRAAFRVFGKYYRRKEIEDYRQGLERTGRTLGPVRDMDVFTERVRAYLDTLPADAQDSVDRLLSTLSRQRDEARANMIGYLNSQEYARFKEGLARFCQTEGMASRPVATDGVEVEPFRVRAVAPVVIYKRLAVVRAYDERVRTGTASLEQLHALRIACKRLRYTLEFFQRLLGPEAQKVIREIVSMQDHLGAIQDVVVAREQIQALLTEQGHDPGIERYLDYREKELEQLLAALPQEWARLNSSKFDRMLAQAVAAAEASGPAG